MDKESVLCYKNWDWNNQYKSSFIFKNFSYTTKIRYISFFILFIKHKCKFLTVFYFVDCLFIKKNYNTLK